MDGDNDQTTEVESYSEEQLDTLYEEQAAGASEEAPEEDKEESESAAEQPAAAEPETSEQEKTVPIHALHEERVKRKELTEKMSQMEGRFQQFLHHQQQAQQAPQEPEQIPVGENPIGHFDQRMAALEQQGQAQVEQNARTAQEQQQAQQWQGIMTQYHNDASRLAAQNPEFIPAYNYWQEGRVKELRVGGANEVQANHIARQEESAAIIRALQEGASPAERVYAIAQARGYKPSASAADTGPDPATIAKGQTAGRRSPSGGKPPAGQTLEALSAMSDEDFEANWDKIVGTG